ncbi:MAG: Fic family protein [Candidatus Moranbacteria bacterium]|nr:Fic family protein [Candidatus Moranbacteria bacterium]MDD3964475.1 Fic family protein [Candidatus Moranbacteria bacterium]
MNTKEKLQIIQNISGLTQTAIATKIGVSFVAFNNWWNKKSQPRRKHETIIDDLYKEYTGQKNIPETVLVAKKELIIRESKKYDSVLGIILKNSDIYNQFLLSLTYNSNKIEGSTLSEDETADIMFENRSIPNKSLIEQLEVKNHQAALQYLFHYLKKSKRIDEMLMLKLHSMLMNGIRDDAGMYRRHGVRIVGSNVPTANYMKVPILMKNISLAIEKKQKDVITHVSNIHGRFEQIHPFSDGNGRLGRLVLVAMLLRENIAPATIQQEEKQLYYASLRRAQLKEDFTQLEDFICDATLFGFGILKRK